MSDFLLTHLGMPGLGQGFVSSFRCGYLKMLDEKMNAFFVYTTSGIQDRVASNKARFTSSTRRFEAKLR
jgi:hypothetical protein